MSNIWARWTAHNGAPKNANSSSQQPSMRLDGWNILHQSRRLGSVNIDAFDSTPLAGTSGAPVVLPTISLAGTECIICREVDVVLACATDRCQHRGDTCADCITQIVKFAISESNLNIKCPNTACKEVMEYDDIKMWAEQRTFERYEELLLQRLLQQEEGYVTCLNPACGAGQVHGGENIFPIVTCYKCGAKTCYRHREEWHEGYSCKEWDKREERWKKENLLSKEWVDSNTKRCPGPGCNRPINKINGCDHMVCRACFHEFCWSCLAPYVPIRDQGNHHHKKTCIHFSGYRPPVASPPVNQQQEAVSRRRWLFWRRHSTAAY